MSGQPRTQVTTPEALPDERLTDAALRPSRLDEFVGQAKVKESLQIAIDAAKQRHEPLDHALFFGAVLLAAYGAFALIRDGLRWRRKRLARSS